MKTIIAIIAIMLLAGYALYMGVDGAVLGSALTSIAGLAGYGVGYARGKKKQENSKPKDKASS